MMNIRELLPKNYFKKLNANNEHLKLFKLFSKFLNKYVINVTKELVEFLNFVTIK